METPIVNNTLKKNPNVTRTPVTMETPLDNSTLNTPFIVKTDSVMKKDSMRCSLEECANQHLAILVALSGVNIVLILIIFICTKRNWKHESRLSRHKDIEDNNDVKEIAILERTTQDNREPSTTTRVPVTPPLRCLQRPPLPVPQFSIGQNKTTSEYTDNPMYLEIISNENTSYSTQRQGLGISNQGSGKSKQGSFRGMAPNPPPRHRPNLTRQPLEIISNTVPGGETASYVEPCADQGANPYEELQHPCGKTRRNSVRKSGGYRGLNSLTRISTKKKSSIQK